MTCLATPTSLTDSCAIVPAIQSELRSCVAVHLFWRLWHRICDDQLGPICFYRVPREKLEVIRAEVIVVILAKENAKLRHATIADKQQVSVAEGGCVPAIGEGGKWVLQRAGAGRCRKVARLEGRTVAVCAVANFCQQRAMGPERVCSDDALPLDLELCRDDHGVVRH